MARNRGLRGQAGRELRGWSKALLGGGTDQPGVRRARRERGAFDDQDDEAWGERPPAGFRLPALRAPEDPWVRDADGTLRRPWCELGTRCPACAVERKTRSAGWLAGEVYDRR